MDGCHEYARTARVPSCVGCVRIQEMNQHRLEPRPERKWTLADLGEGRPIPPPSGAYEPLRKLMKSLRLSYRIRVTLFTTLEALAMLMHKLFPAQVRKGVNNNLRYTRED